MVISVCLLLAAIGIGFQGADLRWDYRVLATNRTSTMEKEMNQAAEAGYVFMAVMGGETGFGGKEVVVVMGRDMSGESNGNRKYKLLATSKTGTLQKELQQAGDEGYAYLGQTVFESSFGGKEVSVILELNGERPVRQFKYLLLATKKTSTMQKELQQAGDEGFKFLGMMVGKTSFGGNELICFLGKAVE